MNGNKLKQTVAEMFPPARRFDREICDMPALFSALRDFLDSRGANLKQHRSRRVMMTLATGLYEEAKNTLAAVEMAASITAAGRRARANQSSQSTTASPKSAYVPSEHGPEMIAHNVAMRLRENDKTFSGDLGENWIEFVDDYAQIARDYSLHQAQKLQYLHNALRGDATRYYLDRVDGYASNYQQAIYMISIEFNSPVRQTRVKNYLSSLRVSSMEAKGTEVSSALSQVYRIITKFSRQALQSHQGDAHKVEFFRNAVVGYQWSQEPLSRVPMHNPSFQVLYGEFEAALQLHKEAKLALVRDQAEQRSLSAREPTVFYEGQGRYLRDPSTIRSKSGRSAGTAAAKVRFDPLSIQGCFNCDASDHALRACTHPINTAKAAVRKMEYYAKKDKGKTYAVHHVLADLCHQLDVSTTSVPETEDNRSDAEIFQTMLAPDILSGPTLPSSAVNEVEQNDIYLINYQFANTRLYEFLGACIDAAAQKTVIGKPQAMLYCDLYGAKLELHDTSRPRPDFSFGTHRHAGLGILEVRVPVAASHYIPLRAEMVNMDIPLLFGLDAMTDYGVILDTEKQTLSMRSDGWNV